MLEIAVCAQHNNGGLSGNIWWESTNISHLFPIGEVNGTHGVTRPGGSALNSGQVGAFRAAEYIAAKYRENTVDEAEFAEAAGKVLAELDARRSIPAQCVWKDERREFQHRMSSAGAFVRESGKVTAALDEAYNQYARLINDGLGGLSWQEIAETLRNRQLCTAQIFYLEAILMQIDYIGSRGGSLVLSPEGELISEKLGSQWRIKPENKAYRKQVMLCYYAANGYPEISFEPCREIPESDGWFENVWRDCRSGRIYENDL
jgi:hypothetical protein